jgi:hypothetical protein
METITGKPFDYCGAAYADVCDALLYIYEGVKGVEAICNVANLYRDALNSSQTGYSTSTNNAKTRTLQQAPTCLEKSQPGYADLSGDNTGYDIAVASIVSIYLKDGKTKRSNDDAVGTFMIGYAAAITANAAGEGCDSEVIKIFTLGGCLAAKTAAAVALGVVEIVSNQLAFHDGGIDSAEIAATLENSNRILDQTCSVLGQVNQANQKLDQANQKLDEANRKLDQANQKLDKLLCPFGTTPGFTALGQGCDAIDQNCNGETDECAEDNVPPSIVLKEAIPDIPFKSTDDALAFLSENVVVSDDCAVSLRTTFQLLSGSNCCNCQFQVRAEDARCIKENPSGKAEASKIFVLKVDRNPPVISAGFFTQQDPFHVSGGFDPCGGLPVPFPGENDQLHIDQNCFGSGLFDVAIWYQIEVSHDKSIEPGRLPCT